MWRQSAISIVAVILTCLGNPYSCQGAEYRSPKGYQLEYPDAWKVATAENMQTLEGAVKKMMTNVDFSRIDAMIYNPRSYQGQNVIVEVLSVGLPIDDQAVAKVESALRDQYSKAGISLRDFHCELATVGGHDCVCATWTAGYGVVVSRQREYVLSGRRHAFIVTCSAGTRDFGEVEPTFRQILASFQIAAEPSATLTEWWAGLSPFVRDAIIGGAAGGLAGGIAALAKSRKNKAAGAGMKRL